MISPFMNPKCCDIDEDFDSLFEIVENLQKSLSLLEEYLNIEQFSELKEGYRKRK